MRYHTCIEFLDLRAHVWGIRECSPFSGNVLIVHWIIPVIEQDLHALSKKEGTTVRIV